jgi:SAM-dependent methyltransferase
MAQHVRPAARADYGLDAPGLVRGFLLGGPTLIALGLAGLRWGAYRAVTSLGVAALITGALLAIEGLLMIWSSRRGKFRARDRLLDDLGLRGDETVLDVGTGHGLLLIGAAKRLPRGRAIGVDLWSQVDQADNSKAATLANAQAEGVAGRVEVRDGDMRQLPLPDASVDAVVASLSIHNIYGREGRRAAIGEIARVLRPGGKAALMDFQHTREYAADLRAAGLREVSVSSLSFWIFPPVRTVTATKP